MVDLTSLLSETSAEDLVDVVVPKGTWKCAGLSARFGDEGIDKNGTPYRMAKITLKPIEAFGDVDADELAEFETANGYEEGTLWYNKYIARNSEVVQLRNLLESVGISPAGKTVEDMMEAVNKNYVFTAEVDHETDKETGKPRTTIKKLYAPVE